MTAIPRASGFDSTLALFRDGYRFVTKRSRRHQSDIFQTRILFQKTICMVGAEAAEVFYDTERFTRVNAAPRRLNKTLFGVGGVQALDGQAHHWRKQMFLALMTPERIRQLGELSERGWRQAAAGWQLRRKVVLFDEVAQLLTKAVCEWAGVPLPAHQARRRAHEMTEMAHGAGAVGPAFWSGERARRRGDRWARGLVERARAGKIAAPAHGALAIVANHRDLEGCLLDPHTAAVELLNVLRPVVQVARFITFAALALHEHPEQRERLRGADDDAVWRFTQEVRRYYPFFPFVAARVRKGFSWRGFRFPRGRRVLLDLYGTNHDPRIWHDPERFDPERFRDWQGDAYGFIPQGGGDHYRNHRCPGEWVTIELMKVAVRCLAGPMRYSVPRQDLRVSLREMPALPKSRFVISEVGWA